ncbi:ferrichrome ABC transporter permease [Pelistega indica]|uniref:Ferrichrome ABC transporter permease n=1 Tax=Pelistega indica TaxID=1414851 RepID=V8G6P7_9BURK|nr:MULTISPECIES: iron chelate uptake ABC transporter family permease subunit [Pelistega]ETD71357.1 ferrichrome ABC transporter permease [Pelistega indica]
MVNLMLLPVSRARYYNLVLVLIMIPLVLLSMTIGRSQNLLPLLSELIQGNATGISTWLFEQLWLPRTLVAIGVGIALSLAGAIFQTLTRNPLGSPDMIGVNTGASLGLAAVTIIWPRLVSESIGALFGALIIVFLAILAKGRRQFSSVQIIVAGLALNAMALALIQFVIIGIRPEAATQLTAWMSGSLSQRDWSDVITIWMALPLLLSALVVFYRPLNLLNISPMMATTLGVNVPLVSLKILLLGTLFAVVAVVAAGPIAFISLISPHIVKRMIKSNRFLIMPTALTGVILVLIADLISRLLPYDAFLPVGIITSFIGGIYLCVLLIVEWKKSLCN